MPILPIMFDTSLPSLKRRSPAIAVTLALHAALFAAWQGYQRSPAATPAQPYRPIDLIMIPFKQPRVAAPAPAVQPKPPPAVIAAARPAAIIAARAAPPPVAVTEAAPVAAPLPAARSADEIMQQARRDLGKIDKELRKAYPGAPITAPPDSPQIRLVKGIELAHDMAPPGLFEAPKVTEIIDPGPYGRKRYRVITALGTYCLTYESNHAPDGQDVFVANRTPKMTNCEKNEQPATKQNWNKPF